MAGDETEENVGEVAEALAAPRCVTIVQLFNKAALGWPAGEVITDSFSSWPDASFSWCLIATLTGTRIQPSGMPTKWLDAHEECCDTAAVLRDYQADNSQLWQVSHMQAGANWRITQTNTHRHLDAYTSGGGGVHQAVTRTTQVDRTQTWIIEDQDCSCN